MGTKYIVELEDGEHLYKTTINALGNPVIRSAEKVPYTEPDLKEVKEKAYKEDYKAGLNDERNRQPDLEQVKKEAYEKGWKAAEDNYDSGYSDGYDAGLDDVWKAVRKIQEMDIDTLHEVFGWVAGKRDVFIEYTAAKVIERLRAYEQEQDEKKKTAYYFEMMKDAIETSAKEYGMSLDEVAAVLESLRRQAPPGR